MRRILVDLARSRSAMKRGGQRDIIERRNAVNLDQLANPDVGHQVLAVEDALQELERQDARKARVVELRFYGGLSVEETAQALQISPQTVMRDWKLARAWRIHQFDSAAFE